MTSTPANPQQQPQGFKTILTRVSTIRNAYPNSVSIYRDLNTTYQSSYEIAVNVSEQYKSYKRGGTRISGIRSLLADCDVILKSVHEFLRRYSSLRSQAPSSKQRFAFVSEDIGYQRHRLGICREKLGVAQDLLNGQQSVNPEKPIPTVQVEDEAGKEVPVENIDLVPQAEAHNETVPPPHQEEPLIPEPEPEPIPRPKPKPRTHKRNTRLASAASSYRWNEVRFLIEKGADVNTPDSTSGLRPLVYALKGRYKSKYRDQANEASSIVRLLLSRGAKFGKSELAELPRAGTFGEREYRKWVTKENLECDVEDLRFEGFRDSGVGVGASS